MKSSGINRVAAYFGDRPDCDINIVGIIKGRERWFVIFHANDDGRADALRRLGMWASDPDLSFTWYDAAVLSQKVRQGITT